MCVRKLWRVQMWTCNSQHFIHTIYSVTNLFSYVGTALSQYQSAFSWLLFQFERFNWLARLDERFQQCLCSFILYQRALTEALSILLITMITMSVVFLSICIHELNPWLFNMLYVRRSTSYEHKSWLCWTKFPMLINSKWLIANLTCCVCDLPDWKGAPGRELVFVATFAWSAGATLIFFLSLFWALICAGTHTMRSTESKWLINHSVQVLLMFKLQTFCQLYVYSTPDYRLWIRLGNTWCL